jgi:hypothetical protein
MPAHGRADSRTILYKTTLIRAASSGRRGRAQGKFAMFRCWLLLATREPDSRRGEWSRCPSRSPSQRPAWASAPRFS